MFNHARGLWGYTGTAADGRPLTIMSHGMGGPSAAIVVEELCDLGLEVLVRVGTCGALDARLAAGDLVAATSVLSADGTSRALGAGEQVAPDPALTEQLAARADHGGRDRLDRSLLRPGPGAEPRRGARPAHSRSRWRPRRC